MYTALMSELQSDTASVEKIARLVSKDVGITAKLLQMVNSAFFGLPTQVESPLQAVNLLGFDTVQGLVLAAGTYSRLEADGLPGLSIDGIYPHSMAVGTGAQKIAKALDLDKRKAQDALMAGLLHDIGHLVMLRYFRPELQEALKLSGGVWSELIGAEQQVLGATHAEIGAHLLSLWGLPDSIVEAVAYHHVPSQTPHPMIDVLTAVHLANAFERDHDGVEETHVDLIDNTYITNLGLSERLASLREASPAPVAE
ncbi:HDOD domain-containing protein [candidate division GN15 bacterium]|nr:HDOD domain-containing protein [candidate division GN15 bacterium]